MVSDAEVPAFQLLYAIVEQDLGSKVLHTARRFGIIGGTIFLARGTARDRILNLLGISEIGKEVVLMVSNTTTAESALEQLAKEFKFQKPNHGVAFSTAVCQVAGSRYISCTANQDTGGAQETMYRLVTAVVDKGKGEQVIDAAIKAGSKGGTIINARGSGIHERSKVFSIEIEPEKEVVLIVTSRDKAEAIIDCINRDLKIEEPANGMILVQDVVSAYGLRE